MQFKLASFNLHNLGREDNPDPRTYEAKLAFIANVLVRINADITVVNEIREPASFEELADAVGGFTFRLLADPPTEHRRIQTGILSRLPVLDSGQWSEFPFVLPDRPGCVQTTKFRRPTPWVKVRLPNSDPLLVVAVHLKSQRAEIEAVPSEEPYGRRLALAQGSSVLGRIMEAVGLRCLIEAAMDAGTAKHYVVLGDFNGGLDSDPVRLVAGADSGDPVGESAFGRRLTAVGTWLPEGCRFSYLGRTRKELLDQILVSQDLALGLVRTGVESHLLQPSLRPPEQRSSYPRSDHAPVWALFELPVATPTAHGA